MPGPLTGLRIIELAGIGPGPFAGMMLADHGAEVIHVDRIGTADRTAPFDVLHRSRKSILVDLKTPEGRTVIRDLAASADGFIEGFRPGVTERLGLGPEVLTEDNPRLVYGRMTGWGQTGPYAQSAGHDINYIALSGALDPMGRAGQPPTPPLNLVGDFGGGGMVMAFGMVSAILNAQRTGKGQVVDCAMTDGSALLMSMIWGMFGSGMWSGPRGTNLLDTGAPFYDVYETADGKHVSIGSIEPQFYAQLCALAGIADDPAFDNPMDSSRWPDLKLRMAEIFKTRTRDAWCALMEHTDVCFAPVLAMHEAPAHPHNQSRETFVTIDGCVQPGPAPRFSGTPSAAPRARPRGGADSDAVLSSVGYGSDTLASLRSRKIIG